MMRSKPHAVLLVVLGACSNGTTPEDGGADAASDTATGDAQPDNDAGLDGDAAAPSKPEALDQANKLALWLEASPSQLTIADGGVATWKDKSKNHNDATAPNGSPVIESGAIAGHDAVHFNAFMTTLSIMDAASLRFGTDQVHIVAVTKVLTLRSFFFSKSHIGDAGYNVGLDFFTANGGAPADGGVFSLSPYAAVGVDSVTWGNGNELADGKFHIVAFRRVDATHLAVSIDDLAPRVGTVAAAADVSAAGQAVAFGPMNGPSTPDFSIVEELIVHDATGVVSDADVSGLHAYLKQKYGL
jgi:hypothetical protein